MRRLAVLLLVLLPVLSAAGDIPVGDLMTRADRGDATAQTVLGIMYLRGDQVAPDTRIAANWLLKAAAQDSFIARYALGALLCPSCVPEPDWSEAAGRFREAAERGQALAQANLARLLKEGRGVPQDPAQALMWYEIAKRAPQEGVAALARREADELALNLPHDQVFNARTNATRFMPKELDLAPRR
jgi:TPR repeat protein